MQRTTMHVGDHAYALSESQDIPDLKSRSIAAVRDGGDLVTVAILGNGEVEIMVSGGTVITFTTEEVPNNSSSAELDDAFPSYDYDQSHGYDQDPFS